MPNSKQIVYLSQAQYAELIANGTITVNGVTVTYDENDIYVTPQAEPVTDVRVNGTSVTANGVGNIPVATSSNYGVLKASVASTGLQFDPSGYLKTYCAAASTIKAGTDYYQPIVPVHQHESVFYGLSKVAGVDLASETVTVGTYSDTSKAAIQTMLGIGALIAPTESSTMASQAYAINDLFLNGGKLYKATAAISEGAAFDSTSNCQVTSIAAEMVRDVQIDGTSIVNNGVATIPVAGANSFGVVRVSDDDYGIGFYGNGRLVTKGALPAQIKSGSNGYKPITPATQNYSVFYGLAKAAGDSTQSASANEVGTYTTEAKAAIRSMLGATSPDIVAIQAATPTSTDTKVWIPNSTPTITTVPTYAEFTAGLAEKAPVGLGITGTAAGQFIKVNTVDANGVPLTYAAEPMKYTLTVTAVTQDNITVSGQIVTVRDTDANGQIYGTATYSGQPVSFALPVGFSYYVSISDTLEHHFNPTTASGIITNTNVSVTLTYSDFSSIRTAADIKAALNADMDLTDLVGETISCSKGSDTLVWDVADYDSTNHTITLLLHDAFGSANMVFEPVQALMWCENGLAAGNYTFKWSSTQVYFTLTTAIPAGGQLRATNSAFSTYESQSAIATLETGTVSTTEITGATDLGTTGQGLLNHHDRVNYGSNNYIESALLWWLNSDAAANTPRVPVTKFSRAYSYNVAGFLNGLDANFVSCLDDTVWKCSTNNVYECPASLGGATPGKTQTYTVTAKIGLASEMEIFGSYGGNADGSTIFDLYNGATADDRKKYRSTTAQVWWLRSPNWSGSGSERGVNSSGGAHTLVASTSYAVVPATKISKTTL